MRSSPLLLAVMLLAASTARAQLVADGATNTLSNVTTNITGSVTVGTNSSFTLLVLSDNALLTNSLNGIIGRNAAAKSNEVHLISSTARWRMGGSLFVGSNGAASRLVVSNGALLEDFNGTLGFATASSNNSALVTGPGSLWTNSGSFFISGAFLGSSSSNRLVVSNSAELVAVGGSSVAGIGNQVVVIGPGSQWANQSGFSFAGTSNRVEVSGGAGMTSGSASISGGGNTVSLTGTGTAWTNSGALTLGILGVADVLTASNGASLVVGGGASLGGVGGDNFNSVWVTDPGTSCTIGSNLYVGSGSFGNLLAISNGGFVMSSNATIGGSILGASGNSALVVGAGSVWTNRNLFTIGGADHGNRVVVSNGAAVFTGGDAVLGAQFGAYANSLLVSAATLSVAGNTVIGSQSGADSNSVVITDPGSSWMNGVDILVGSNSSFNQLVISNGATVQSSEVVITYLAFASNNEAVVTGPGSRLTSVNFVVGHQGNGSRLVVSNGGTVSVVGFSNVGANGNGQGNEAIVTGAGSIWSNSFSLRVGEVGDGNRLVITNSGEVFAQHDLTLGGTYMSKNPRLILDGGTLRMTNADGTALLNVIAGTNVLNAGLIEADQLLMYYTNGFFEFNGGTLITRGATVSNGAVFVVGAGGATPAIWDVRASVTNTFVASDIWIGNNASFNQLLVTNGAVLTNFGYGRLGKTASAKSNSITLGGAGSRWLLGGGVIVGDFGSANSLVVSNGATIVAGSYAVLGYDHFSSNNEAVVTGPGSSWTNNLGEFVVGGGGSGNRLTVSDGAQLASPSGRIGAYFSDSSNNLAMVTGPGSSWTNATELRVGDAGAANQLVVSNGCAVSAGSAVYLGFADTSTNNRVTVDSGTLRVTNASATGLLEIRRGTSVLNSGLIEADIVRMTNPPQGVLQFNAGTLVARSSKISSGTLLSIGNGISPATMMLAGNGLHDWSGNLFVLVSSNAVLTGNGTLVGGVSIASGGMLIPGSSVGKMIFTNAPQLHGTVLMEISKNATVLTNDQVQAIIGTLTYGGILTVSNIGPTALATGDRFQLFSATNYAGSFSSISLPPLAAGLGWTNKLLLDGSIEVLSVPISQPTIGSITVSGTNLIISGTNGTAGANYALLTTTNVALPLSNWLSLLTNQFGPGGGFAFTNPIAPGELQRFFQIRTP